MASAREAHGISERRRFGYRRLGLLLRREGVVMNHKRLRRLYCEERLQVRRRGGPQAGDRDALPDRFATSGEPALVAGLCLRRAG